MHKVTLDEIMPAIDKEIVLAGSFKSAKKLSKKLTFNPAKLVYRVRYSTEFYEDSTSFKNPQDAVDQYNNYDA